MILGYTLFCCFIIYYLLEEKLESKVVGLESYLDNVWNWMDLLILAFSFVVLTFIMVRDKTSLAQELYKTSKTSPAFVDLEKLVSFEENYNKAIGCLTFLAWIKILKFSSLTVTMTQLWSTLRRCAPDLIGCLIMFVLALQGLAHCGFVFFASQDKDFSSFHNAFFALFQITIGRFDYPTLEMASDWGPWFYLLAIVMLFFLFTNTFLAVINDTYSELRADMVGKKRPYEIADYIKETTDEELMDDDELPPDEDVATRTVGPHVNMAEFTDLANRVSSLEEIIGGIVSQLDTVLVRLENMEGVKVRTRALGILERVHRQPQEGLKLEGADNKLCVSDSQLSTEKENLNNSATGDRNENKKEEKPDKDKKDKDKKDKDKKDKDKKDEDKKDKDKKDKDKKDEKKPAGDQEPAKDKAADDANPGIKLPAEIPFVPEKANTPFQKLIQSIWATGQTVDTKEDRELYFAKEPLLDSLHWESASGKDDIYYYNKLLGRPRLRQVRVRKGTCEIGDLFTKLVTGNCFAEYSSSNEDKVKFGPINPPSEQTGWIHASAEDAKGSSHAGIISTYDAGGYVQLLSDKKEDSKKLIDGYFQNRWIDRATRAVFIDFTVYNANINLFCIVRLLVEFPATGGAFPSWTFRTVKLIRYSVVQQHHQGTVNKARQGEDQVVVVVVVVVMVVVVLLKLRFKYLDSFWNIMDMSIVTISGLAVLFNLSVFKYISFNKTMAQLSRTLGRCAKDLTGFSVMFIIIFLAFTQLGYLLFGPQVKDFSTFLNSFFTLFRIILGDFDFQELQQANRVLGPIYFMLFVFFVFFVLINMFLAIINDTYSEVKSDMAAMEDQYEMADFFRMHFEKLLGKVSQRTKIIDAQKALMTADANKDKKVDYAEWSQDMKSRGYPDHEIEAIFKKYDVDGNGILDADEVKKMTEELKRKIDLLNAELQSGERTEEEEDEDALEEIDLEERAQGPHVQYEDFVVLSRRVDRLEHSIGSIVAKLDAMLIRLEGMQGVKHKGRVASILEVDKKQMKTAVREDMRNWWSK
nr:hypothetical protein BaRGS_000140 [Batillaria attramentaria]